VGNTFVISRHGLLSGQACSDNDDFNEQAVQHSIHNKGSPFVAMIIRNLKKTE